MPMSALRRPCGYVDVVVDLDYLIASQQQVVGAIARLREAGFEAGEGPEVPGNHFPLRVAVSEGEQESVVERLLMPVDPEVMHVGGFGVW